VLTVDRPVEGTRPRSKQHRTLGPLPAGAAVTTHLGDGSTREHKPSKWDKALSYPDLDWLAGFGLPLAVKGILRADDARRVLDHGVDCVIVSNHGGRQLDGAIPTARALPEVVEAVAGRASVLVDGGIRSGGAAFRALALGADAVLIGRPYIWGLAADGERGVAEVLSLLTDELIEVMTLTGAPTVKDITRDLVVRR